MTDLPPLRCIHLWAPELNGTGGIQHYSRCLADALRELYPEARIVIYSRKDFAPAEDAEHRLIWRCFGQWRGLPGHALFALAALLALLWERPGLCIATHASFARVLRWVPRLGVPCFISAHGIEVWGEPLQRVRGALSDMSAILSVSQFTKDILIREGGMLPERVTVVSNTFREGHFSPGPKPEYLLARHGLTAEQPVLLTVGRLAACESYKGHDQVIAALPAIRRIHPLLRYVIAGDGDDKPRLQACAEHYGQQEAVIFAGYIPDGELPDYYRLCNAFVMPSTGEGFGIVYLEALGSGRPCVVGDRDASSEAIDDGRLGIVIDPRAPEEIAEAVVRLLRRDHDKPWLHEPEQLQLAAKKLYGQAAFKHSLASALRTLLQP